MTSSSAEGAAWEPYLGAVVAGAMLHDAAARADFDVAAAAAAGSLVVPAISGSSEETKEASANNPLAASLWSEPLSSPKPAGAKGGGKVKSGVLGGYLDALACMAVHAAYETLQVIHL